MRKQINIIVILAIIAVILILGLGFIGFKGFNAQSSSPAGSLAAAQAIMQELQEKGSVSSLRVADIVEGTGESVQSGDVVVVHYTGMLPDGTVFDSSALQGNPVPFPIGIGYVIPGWVQGLIGMKEGGRRLLVIPPSLGYGENGNGTIPPNATLVFEVELLDRMTTEEYAAANGVTTE